MSFPIDDILWAFSPIFGLFIGFFTLFSFLGYENSIQKTLAIWLITATFANFLFGEFYTGGCYLASLVLLWLLTIKEKEEIINSNSNSNKNK